MNFSGKVNNGPAASRTIMWIIDIVEAFEVNRRAMVLARKTMIVMLLKVIVLLFFIISLRVVCKNVALIFFHTQNKTVAAKARDFFTKCGAIS